MKLEEALPAYREGKVIVSCRGFRYRLGATAEYYDVYPLDEVSECEVLGEWTVEKMNVYPYGPYSTRERADEYHQRRLRIATDRIAADRVARVEFCSEYEVEE